MKGVLIVSLQSVMFNIGATINDYKRDKAIPLPEGIQQCRNISYGSHGKWNLLDVYYPDGTTQPLPTIVSIHGGGYVYGSKEIYRRYGMDMARRGFAFVNFNYRLALLAAEQGIDKIRINPGNIGDRDRVKAVSDECKKRGIPIRIGVNGGSLEKHILEKYGAPCPEALFESAMFQVSDLSADRCSGRMDKHALCLFQPE